MDARRLYICIAFGGLMAMLLGITVGCVQPPRAPVVPPTGFIFTQVAAPLQTDLSETDVRSLKSGESATNMILIPLIFLNPQISWGDGSVKAASAEGKIDEVEFADYEFMSVLGVYSQTKTKVYGREKNTKDGVESGS